MEPSLLSLAPRSATGRPHQSLWPHAWPPSCPTATPNVHSPHPSQTGCHGNTLLHALPSPTLSPQAPGQLPVITLSLPSYPSPERTDWLAPPPSFCPSLQITVIILITLCFLGLPLPQDRVPAGQKQVSSSLLVKRCL